MIRLRQVALVAAELDPVVQALCDAFDLHVCHRDPGLAEFGLHNALMVVGDQFLEVVAPTVDGTTAGRLLDKRGGDGGYMAIFEVDDLDRRLRVLAERDVRVVWSGDLPRIRGRHLHPRDVGGTLVSIDEPAPEGSWHWAGPDWRPHRSRVVGGIAGVTVAGADPGALADRWRELDLDTSMRFAAAGPRGDGLDAIELVAVDRRRVGTTVELGGVAITLV